MRPTDRMPTAGKLVSAIGLGALAWYSTGIVKAIWPVEQNFGYFSPFAALVGVVMGWRVMGHRLGRGYAQGISAGWTGLFALVFWVVLLLAFYEMIQRSLKQRYSGLFDAAQDMGEIAITYLANVAHLPLIGLLLGGAAVVGLVAEAITRRGR